jgi:hypothetical protein
MLGQICGQDLTTISLLDLLLDFPAKILPDDIHRPKHFHAHPYYHLLTCPDDVSQWFWGGHLVHVSHAGSELWLVFDNISLLHLLPDFPAKIPPDDIHRPKHFHDHPYHHLLTCPDDVNEWFWGGHLVHVSHAGSDLWLGFDNISLLDL